MGDNWIKSRRQRAILKDDGSAFGTIRFSSPTQQHHLLLFIRLQLLDLLPTHRRHSGSTVMNCVPTLFFAVYSPNT